VNRKRNRELALEQENRELRELVGALSLEVKKNGTGGVFMKRKTSEKVVELNKPILDAIRLIKEEHPFWGYRRVWGYSAVSSQLHGQ